MAVDQALVPGEPSSFMLVGVKPKKNTLLSYSPDHNPIEQVFAKLKTLPRKTAARALDIL